MVLGGLQYEAVDAGSHLRVRFEGTEAGLRPDPREDRVTSRELCRGGHLDDSTDWKSLAGVNVDSGKSQAGQTERRFGLSGGGKEKEEKDEEDLLHSFNPFSVQLVLRSM